MKMMTFQCFGCGLIYKMLIMKDGNVRFSCMDKQHSEKQLFKPNGYFCCIHCKEITKIRLTTFH